MHGLCTRVKNKVYLIRAQMVMQFINQSELRTERTWPDVSYEVNKHLGTRLPQQLTKILLTLIWIFYYKTGYYKYCLASTHYCPSCIRQIYLNLFSTSRCLASIGKSQLDCLEHHFSETYTAPNTVGTFNIKVICILIRRKRNSLKTANRAQSTHE